MVKRLEALTVVVGDLRDRLPVLVSVDEAALRLDVSTRTVRRWVRARQIPFVKLSNTVRIDLTTVRAMPANDLKHQVARAQRAA